ncbi:ATP-binding protein [Streptomyces sp. NPDC058685]|uniref:ATP-binding protein n=1 Tax=Streptomyces sp. NPDC058685 TaxID=3346598 RepID=UPI00364CD05B
MRDDQNAVPVGPAPATPAQARREVEFLLYERCCQPHAERDAALSDALLVTSELMTNAVLHGDGVTAFEAALTETGIRISVSDRSPLLPHILPAVDAHAFRAIGGHGWRIITRLARHIAISPRHGGKRISVIVSLP